jgi:hypothetical protein
MPLRAMLSALLDQLMYVKRGSITWCCFSDSGCQSAADC